MDLSRTPAPPPLVAGRYRVGRLLGRGGMADVHAAVDERTGDEVAVKLFRDPAGHDPDRSVADEARTLARLRHPGLVALLDAGEDDGWPYCVMTLVDGPTLAQRMADGPLDPAETARTGAAVAAALAHVHAQGVVHRDVKPANVLLTADGRPLLGDFGIARLVDATRVTRTSLTMGTASYLAPEQVTGAHLGPPVDVYALGLVLLECLTGRREYPGPALESALARLHRPPALPADLPGGWTALLERMTADDPAARPSAGDAAAALAVLAARPDAPRSALPLAPSAEREDRAFPVDLPAVPAPRSRRRRAGLVGALLLAPAAVLATPAALWSGSAASGAGGAAAAPAAAPAGTATSSTAAPGAAGPGAPAAATSAPTAPAPTAPATTAPAPGAASTGAGGAAPAGATATSGGTTAGSRAGTAATPTPASGAAGPLRAVAPSAGGPRSTAPRGRSAEGTATERAERATAPSRSAATRTRAPAPGRTAPARPSTPRPTATRPEGGSASSGSGSSGSSGTGSRGAATREDARERNEDRVRDRSGSGRGGNRDAVATPDSGGVDRDDDGDDDTDDGDD